MLKMAIKMFRVLGVEIVPEMKCPRNHWSRNNRTVTLEKIYKWNMELLSKQSWCETSQWYLYIW